MIKVTVKYGATGRVDKEYREDISYGEIIRDVASFLGFDASSVNVVVDGDTVDLTEEAEDGDTIRVEKRAASKA